MIRAESGTDWREMYTVFNMGHRMEFYVPESIAEDIISIAKSFNIEGRIIGHCKPSDQKHVTIRSEYGEFVY
jgi:phosphoribosylformylglycinamidine cyclo-ligase